MRSALKDTTALVLGFAVVGLALTGCGGDSSEAEIETTGETRIEQKRAEDAVLDAKAQATVQPKRTATPVPLTPTPTNASMPSAVVNFPDSLLSAAIKEALDQAPQDEITTKELAELVELSAHTAGIWDLTGLEHAVNLTGLYLQSNQISDISPLASLTNLTRLYLQTNLISDIRPLAALTDLTELSLRENQISDVKPLASLTSMTTLDIWDNQISDISPLTSLTNLTRLYMHGNRRPVFPMLENIEKIFLDQQILSADWGPKSNLEMSFLQLVRKESSKSSIAIPGSLLTIDSFEEKADADMLARVMDTLNDMRVNQRVRGHDETTISENIRSHAQILARSFSLEASALAVALRREKHETSPEFFTDIIKSALHASGIDVAPSSVGMGDFERQAWQAKENVLSNYAYEVIQTGEVSSATIINIADQLNDINDRVKQRISPNSPTITSGQ